MANDIEVFEADVRTWDYARKLGINPHFTYNRLSKVKIAQVSISYLVLAEKEPKSSLPKLDKKALTAGVRIGWRSTDGGNRGAFFAVYFGTVLDKD